MKKIFLKIGLPVALLVVAIFIIGPGCSSPQTPQTVSCSTTGTDFQNIFSTGGSVTYDFDVHSYSFTVATNKTICSIGYQSTAYNMNNPYTIKILQGTTVIYNQPHIFSNTATSYVTPTTTVNLTAGVTYTIERIQTDSGGSNDENVGRVKPVSFPLNSGDLTITGSHFYFVSANGSSSLVNTNLPFIDIVFQ